MSETTSQSPSKRPLPPRVSSLPLVGCVPSLVANPTAFMEKAQREHGDIFMMDLGITQAIGLCHPRHAHHVLVEQAQNYSKGGPLWISLRTFLGNSLTVSEGDFWKRQRRMIQPAFHHHRVSGLTSVMVEAIDECLSEWDAAAQEGKPFDVSVALNRVTMTVLVRTLFGCALDKGEADQVAQAFKVVLDYLMLGMATQSLPSWVPVPGRQRYRKSIQMIDEVLERIIQRGRQHRSDEVTLLSLMQEAVDGESGEQMTNQQLRDEALGFIIAGYHTAASGMTWVLHSLAKYPEITERVRAELDSVVGESKPGFAELMRMPYTRNVLQESLRIHSPMVWLPRLAVNEGEIDGYRIPQGSVMVIFAHRIHRHPSAWENPLTFDPDRFTPERSAGRHKQAWLPFGAGQRQCIAKEFSLMEGTLMMARILSRYELSSVPGRVAKEVVGANLSTKDGMWLHLRPRKPQVQASAPQVQASASQVQEPAPQAQTPVPLVQAPEPQARITGTV
ncbi:cytochrome P450 [Cystobacter ferrugineus]|uniref:cytochrome P450 n=1 Tax=Cystobacter ferrugineus TaxID=83449 RepID=UPI000A03CC31|nr:cytochrome P450 [Cystobacter ferrugineus]